MSDEMCPCGRPLHYTNPATEQMVRRLVADMGEFVIVETAEGRWRVSRHYLALHGLRADDVPRLGFAQAP